MRIRPNKTKIVITIVVALLLILFLPIPKGTYLDGGTRVYEARLYKIVAWNRVVAYEDPENLLSPGPKTVKYQKTSVYWFEKAKKSIDELWEIEVEKNGAVY